MSVALALYKGKGVIGSTQLSAGVARVSIPIVSLLLMVGCIALQYMMAVYVASYNLI